MVKCATCLNLILNLKAATLDRTAANPNIGLNKLSFRWCKMCIILQGIGRCFLLEHVNNIIKATSMVADIASYTHGF